MKNAILTLSILLSQFTHSNDARAARWNSANDPSRLDKNYQYNFFALPLKGMLPTEKTPWSETYWARDKGSINIRWNAPGTPGFNLHSPTRQEALNMTRSQLAQLSPSEKYDLSMGDYNYTITKEVAKYRAKADAKYWEGLCDGWTAMALQLKEPQPVEVKNPDGIVVPFGSSDVKGLLAYYGVEYADFGNRTVGTYCGSAGAIFNTPNCQDLNPGAYHVILANEIGIKKEGFAAEIDPKREIWNQPIFGFEFEVRGSAKSLTGAKAFLIHAKMHYTDELDQSQWAPVLGTDKFASDVQATDYILELDEHDQIIGGKWLKKVKHPDVFWKSTKKVEFSGKMVGLNQIYSAQ